MYWIFVLILKSFFCEISLADITVAGSATELGSDSITEQSVDTIGSLVPGPASLIDTSGSGSVLAENYYPYSGNQNCTAPNSTFSFCGRDGSCDNPASNIHNWCSPGCYCLDGYVLESANSTRCVLRNECPNPPTCGAYESWELYGMDNVCPTAYLSNYPSEGCHCKPGYFRKDEYSGCSAKPCPECGKNYLFMENGPNIPRTCENYLIYYNVLQISYNTSGCFCQNNFVYDNATQSCILPEDCTSIPLCYNTTVFKLQGSSADCWDYTNGYNQTNNYPGCYCPEGYVFDITSDYPRKCILKSECVCGTNQHLNHYDCVKTCDLRGTNRCDYSSSRRCVCDDGYVFEDSNSTICIPEDKCPNPPVCPYSGQTVRNGSDIWCPSDGLSSTYVYESQDCHCPNGYQIFVPEQSTQLSSNGATSVVITTTPNAPLITYQEPHCISQEKCPSVHCPVNASLRVSTVDVTCDDIRNNNTPSANVSWYDCFCNKGYVRGDDGNCILREECKVCGANQNLAYWGYCADTCQTFSYKGCQNFVSASERSCACNPGYVFESANSTNCILAGNCPSIDCGPNAVFSVTGVSESCQSLNQEVNSMAGVLSLGSVSSESTPGCYCKEGYVRTNDSSYECVLASTCPICSETQYYDSYGNSCARSCNDLRISPTASSCSILSSHNTCSCRDPYILESPNSTKCIDPSECKCGPNETKVTSGVFNTCFTVLTNQTIPFNVDIVDWFCNCNEGYYRRTDSLDCVPRNQCNPCRLYEEYRNGNEFPENSCTDFAELSNTFKDPLYDSEVIINLGSSDLKIDAINFGCFCENGYVRENDTCVPISNCPIPKCRQNEEFKQSGTDEYCSVLNQTYVSNTPKCLCRNGYVRNYKNECILANSCPDCTGSDSNSIFSPCVHCKDYCSGSRNCSWNCLDDCDCKPGYVYNDLGKCVLASSCPNVTTALPPRQIWFDFAGNGNVGMGGSGSVSGFMPLGFLDRTESPTYTESETFKDCNITDT